MNSNQIRARIFSVVPAATWQMEELLSLLDIITDDSIPTACVDCTARPRLRLNADFVAEHCSTDEHLLVLVLHELHHVVLGHTRLFPRPTKAHNIAFDAVINAMICNQFREKRYWSFFNSLNSAYDFPARLLRPPEGWPGKWQYPEDASAKEKCVINLLYGPGKVGATYLEVFELLVDSLKKDPNSHFVLLGNHQDDQAEDSSDPFFSKAIREIVSKWPRPNLVLSGRDQGSQATGWHLDASDDTSKPLQKAFERVLRKAGVHSSNASSTRRLTRIPILRTLETVVPQARDRRIAAWRTLYGTWPVIYRGIQSEEKIQSIPQPVAHVYLDISGSMSGVLPQITAALKRPHRLGLLKLFVFSTVVGEVEPRNLACRVPNTFGTDINCVLEHLKAISAAKRPRRTIVVTDGWVGAPSPRLVHALSKIRFFAAIVGTDSGAEFEKLNANIIKLPI